MVLSCFAGRLGATLLRRLYKKKNSALVTLIDEGANSLIFIHFGQVEHFLVAALVEVHAAQGILRHLGIAFAIAEDVDSRIYGLAHRLLIGFILAGYVVACAVVGTGAHILQSGSEVHPTLHSNHLKWCQSLVVIHGKHTIEVGVLLVAEKSVGCVGPECRDFAIYGFLYGGNYHGLLFLAQQAAVAGMRIERKHCYARAHHAKIALERIVKLYYLLKHQFLGDGAADVGHGHMGGDQCHAHIFAEKYHQRLVAVAYAGFEILGMSRKRKLVALYALFITCLRYMGLKCKISCCYTISKYML